MLKTRILAAALALAALVGGGGCVIAVPYGHGGRHWGPHHRHDSYYYGYGR